MIELTEEKMAEARDLMTPRQQQHLAKLNRKLDRRSYGLWKHLTSDASYAKLEDRYTTTEKQYAAEALERAQREADERAAREVRSYFDTIATVVRKPGPDLRIQMIGQKTWIRATPSMYRQAEQGGLPHRIEPDRVDPAPLSPPTNAKDAQMRKQLRLA